MSQSTFDHHLDLWASSIEDFRPPFDNDRLQSWSTNCRKFGIHWTILPGQYFLESLGTCVWHRVTSVILAMTWASCQHPNSPPREILMEPQVSVHVHLTVVTLSIIANLLTKSDADKLVLLLTRERPGM
jgi:hypothetical protein